MYFEVKIEYKSEPDEKGKVKTSRETVLVDAQTVTESEARVVKYLKEQGETREYTITSSNESKISEVIK